MPEKGLISFIKTKLENTVAPQDIERMLVRAGFQSDKIKEAFEYVKKNYSETHQDLAALNDFLPELRSKERIREEEKQKAFIQSTLSTERQRGLFKGRLRRKDFILGFLFFFSLGYITLCAAAIFVSFYVPELWDALLSVIKSDTDGILTVGIPVILLPVTIMMISLITRRLHNLGLPGGLSFLFLAMFAPPLGEFFYGLLALDGALIILFVVLVMVKGSPDVNIYGPFPESKGSFFKKIFNQ